VQTIERQRISDVVADRIRRHIVDNELQPGDRLPTEHEFAARLGVSRLAVREATRALGFLGLVEASPRRGLTVGTLDFERVAPFLQYHPSLREASADELIETRIIVETGGLPRAAQRMQKDPTIYVQLSESAEALRQAHDVATWIQLDIAFHRKLLEASGLTPLIAFNDLLEIFFQKFRESVKKAEWKPGIESHFRLIDALRAGDVERACRELRAHIESHRERMRTRS
jgi:DNA-binding FadR family transcriptional regulator